MMTVIAGVVKDIVQKSVPGLLMRIVLGFRLQLPYLLHLLTVFLDHSWKIPMLFELEYCNYRDRF